MPGRLVALIANTSSEDEGAARTAGFDAFFPKPLAVKALPALLEWRTQAP